MGTKFAIVWGVLFSCISCVLWAQEQADEPTEKQPVPGLSSQFEDPVLPLVPKTPRTSEQQMRVEARALYAAARLHEQRQQLAQALKLYHQALRYDPDSLAILRQVYPLAFALDRPEEGVRFALKLAQLDPSDQRLIRTLGAHLTDRRDFAGALKLYEKAIEGDSLSKNSPAYVTLIAQMGDLYFLVENYPKASECYDVVLKALDSPKSFGLNDRMRTLLLGNAAATFERFGMAYLKAELAEKAIEAFQRAEGAAPNKGRFALHKAQVFEAQKEPAKALAELEVYFQHQLKEEGAEPYELLAKVLKDLDKQDELITRLEKLLESDSKNVLLKYYLADKYRETKQFDKAEPLYLAALKTAPTSSGYNGLLSLYRERRDPAEMLKTLGNGVDTGNDILSEPAGKALLEDPKLGQEVLDTARKIRAAKDSELTYGMRVAAAMLAAEMKQFSVVNEFYELAIATQPKDLQRVYQQWGLTLFIAEQYDDAARVMQRALTEKVVEPGDPTIHFHLAGALELSGRTDEALKVAREAAAMRVNPPLALLEQRIAWVMYHAKRYRDAIQEYERLLETFPGTQTAKEARLVLSNIYVIKKDMEKAEDYLLQVLDEFPDDPGASNDLGYLWADQGKHLERALKMVQLAIDHDPDNTAYLDSLGWAYYKLGRYAEAITPLETAAKDEDADTTILDHLADCYLRLNRTPEAVELWQKALKAAEKSRNPDPDRVEQIKQKLKLHQTK